MSHNRAVFIFLLYISSSTTTRQNLHLQWKTTGKCAATNLWLRKLEIDVGFFRIGLETGLDLGLDWVE